MRIRILTSKKLAHALVSRKVFSLGNRAWVNSSCPPATGSVEALMNAAVRLPELLELVDRSPASLDSKAILSRLFSLDKDFSNWVAAYQQTAGHRYAYADTGNLGGCGRTPASLRFGSFLSFNTYCLYWICQVLLHAAVTQLVEHQSEQHSNAKRDLIQIAASSRRSANLYARLLRHSIGYALQATIGNVARTSAVRLPIYVLSLWYERSGQSEQASECANLENSIRLSVPALQWDALLPWAFIPLIIR